MTVKELISELQKLPENARVFHLYDGEPRAEINVIYKSKKGHIITSDYNEVCYSTDARPEDAPTSKDDPFWQVYKEPTLNKQDVEWDFNKI